VRRGGFADGKRARCRGTRLRAARGHAHHGTELRERLGRGPPNELDLVLGGLHLAVAAARAAGHAVLQRVRQFVHQHGRREHPHVELDAGGRRGEPGAGPAIRVPARSGARRNLDEDVRPGTAVGGPRVDAARAAAAPPPERDGRERGALRVGKPVARRDVVDRVGVDARAHALGQPQAARGRGATRRAGGS